MEASPNRVRRRAERGRRQLEIQVTTGLELMALGSGERGLGIGAVLAEVAVVLGLVVLEILEARVEIVE